MKKKLILALAACMALLALGLVGCGGGDQYADDAHVGTWSASSIEMDGIEVAASDVFEQFDFTFDASGKATIEYASGGESDSASGKWEPTDNGVILKDSGLSDETMELVDTDAGLALEYQGMTMIFVKK